MQAASGGNSSSIDSRIMHDARTRAQCLERDKYVRDFKNSYVIVALARSRAAALSFRLITHNLLTEERCFDGVGRLSQDPEGLL